MKNKILVTLKSLQTKKNQMLSRIAIFAVLIHASTINAFAAETGVDEDAFKSLIDSYLNPLKNSILYAIPAGAVIAIALMAIRNFFKTEEQKEDFDLIGKIIKTGIIAGLAQSAALVLKIFNVV